MSHKRPARTQTRRETLEELVSKAWSDEFYGYREQLLDLCANIVFASEGDDMVFVGRSPELLYDFINSLFQDTRNAPSLTLLPFSLRSADSGAIQHVNKLNVESVDALQKHFAELGLSPEKIATHKGRLSFVDCVCWGTTFGNLEETLIFMAEREMIDPALVKKHVRYIGITKESLGWTHWRNDEESQGAEFFSEERAKVTTVSAELWEHLAEHSPKTMESFTPDRWTTGVTVPHLDSQTASAIRSTLDLQMFGWRRDVRKAFASKLARRARREDKWLSVLIGNLLKSTQLRRGRNVKDS